MDAEIWVALIAGVWGTIGAVLKIADKYFPGKPPPAPALPPHLPDHMDERLKWYVDRLDQDRERERAEHQEDLDRLRREYEEKLAEARTDHEQLQKFFLDAIERIESLSVNRGRERP